MIGLRKRIRENRRFRLPNPDFLGNNNPPDIGLDGGARQAREVHFLNPVRHNDQGGTLAEVTANRFRTLDQEGTMGKVIQITRAEGMRINGKAVLPEQEMEAFRPQGIL